jgi:hypothetical protein
MENQELKKVKTKKKFEIGNVLMIKDQKTYFKIYKKDNDELVWQINSGIWGTLENFKKVSKDQKLDLIFLANYLETPEILNEIKKPFFNPKKYEINN